MTYFLSGLNYMMTILYKNATHLCYLPVSLYYVADTIQRYILSSTTPTLLQFQVRYRYH